MTAIEHAPRSGTPLDELVDGGYPCQACRKRWPCAGYDEEARVR